MDIRLVRKQLQVEFANLNSADFDSVEIAANDFLDFLHSAKLITEMIAAFPENTIDIDEWVKSLYNTQLSLPRNKQERMSFLLAVLEKYKDDLLSIGRHFNAGGSRKIIDHIRKYIDVMVRPIYQYFDNELHVKELEMSPVSATSITANHSIIISGNNYGSVSQTNIDAVRALDELSEALQKSEQLTGEQKLEAVNNIDTIKNQVVSPKPNKQIIQLAWGTVSAMATTAGAADFATKVSTLITSVSF